MSFNTTKQKTLSSVVGLLNPFSAITRQQMYVPDRVTRWATSMFGDSKDTGIMFWKAAAITLAGMGLVTATRALTGISDTGVLGNSIQGKTKKQISTVGSQLIGEDTGIRAKKADWKENLLHAAVPSAFAIAATASAYSVMDSIIDRISKKKLEKAADKQRRRLNKYIIARAQLARGNKQGQQFKAVQEEVLGKKAGDSSSDGGLGTTIFNFFRSLGDTAKKTTEGMEQVLEATPAALGLIAAGLTAGSAAAAYHYAESRNPARAQYKAAQKARKAFIRGKVQTQTLDTAPISQQVVDKIQGDRKSAAPKREQVELPMRLAGRDINIDI